MNVLFVCHHDFRCNSLTHIAGFAEGLAALGHHCAVAVPDKVHTISAVPSPAFAPFLFADVLRRPCCFPDGRAADVIHAWTPRMHVADCALGYQRRLATPARLVVHLEDNEEHLASSITGRPFEELRLAPEKNLQTLERGLMVHPWTHRLFLHAADAISFITPALDEFAPRRPLRRLLRPGVDEAFFATSEADVMLRGKLGIPRDAKLIVYTGGANPVNAGELRELYTAVALLNAQGIKTRLVRSGPTPRWFKESLTPGQSAVSIDLGFVERDLLPRLLAMADVLVQPGRKGPFNDYRLPSKLAEFLASGRPVVMPDANLAMELKDGEDAVFLRTGDPAEIAAACRRVFDDPRLAARLGRNGRGAARRLFDPGRQSAILAELYDRIRAMPAAVDWEAFRKPHADEAALFSEARTAPSSDLQQALDWLRANPTREAAPPRPFWRRWFARA